MKKLLTPFILALALVITISSCEKEEAKTQVGASMFGTYSGNVTGDLRVIFPPAADIDTTFLAPGVSGAVGTLAGTTYDDSLSLRVQLTVDGTPIDITVLGHIDSETTFSVPTTIYQYLGAVDLRVSGSGTITGNAAAVEVNITEPDGTTDAIFGDLDFAGSK